MPWSYLFQWLYKKHRRQKAGVQCLLDLYGCPFELLDSPEFITQAIHEAAQEARTNLLEKSVHRFHPQGVTGIGLLAESHVSIHTWPEHGYAAIDLFTCGSYAKPKEACLHLTRMFQSIDFSFVEIVRYALPRS